MVDIIKERDSKKKDKITIATLTTFAIGIVTYSFTQQDKRDEKHTISQLEKTVAYLENSNQNRKKENQDLKNEISVLRARACQNEIQTAVNNANNQCNARIADIDRLYQTKLEVAKAASKK